MSKSDPTRRDALPVGTSLREYTLDRVVGHGGFGIVYKASHRELGVAAAIKEYLPIELAIREGMAVRPRSSSDSLDYEDGLRRFRDEARALMQFRNHPTIVTCREFFQEHGTAYLVMEFEDGLPLAQVLATRESEGRPFEEADLFAVMVPLVEGLRDVHEAGLLHRDIKPSNILIRSRDQHPVLIDFGTAKQLVAKQTKSMAPFTEGYAALEQVADAGELGPWTDLYGVGAVMWRMVAGGQRPWEPPHPVRVESRSHAAVAGANDPLPPASQLGKSRFSREVLDAIDACLRLREKDRVQSCRDLLRTLQAVQFVPVELKSPQGSEQSKLSNHRTHPDLWAFLQSKRIPLVFRLVLGWPLARINGLPVPLRIIRDLKSPNVRLLEKLSNAIQKDALGQFAVARMYASGSGVVKDRRQEVEWYRRAAEQGHLQAQYQLGCLYFNDLDVTSAIKWWKISAEQGHSASQYELGRLYESDDIVQDHSQSAKWYSKAAAQGHAMSQHELATHYSLGYGVVKDDERALKWHKLAANMGHEKSQRELGDNYYHGRLVTKDLVKSAQWYRQAAEQGDEFAQHMIGIQYFHGHGVDQDESLAAFWLNKAADNFQLEGSFYREVFPGVLAECYFVLGELYETGRGVPKDEVIAYKWYHLSADIPQDQDRSLDEMNSHIDEELDPLGEFEDDEYEYCTNEKAVTCRNRIAKTLSSEKLSLAKGMVVEHREKCAPLIKWDRYLRRINKLNEGLANQPETKVVPHSPAVSQEIEADKSEYNSYIRAEIQLIYRMRNVSRACRTLLFWVIDKTIGLDVSIRLVRDLDSPDNDFMSEVLAAMLGDASGQYEIGVRYAAGEGVVQDPTEAVSWIRRSTEQNHAGAQFFFGFLYYIGYGVKRDPIQAAKWFRLAVDQGVSAQRYVLFDVSCIECDDDRDYKNATKWYNCFANQGRLTSRESNRYSRNRNDKVDKICSNSAKWYRRIAVQGDPWAQYGFGAQCVSSEGLGPDYSVAAKWFRLSAEQGHPEAQYHLGRLYDKGKGVTQSYVMAATWYRRAAEQGDELAQCRLGAMYCFGEGVEQNYVESRGWYRRAAEQGHESARAGLTAVEGEPSAQYELAVDYSKRSEPEDAGRAIKLYHMAADHGHVRAQYALGWSYYLGHDVEKNFSVAAKWFRMAAEQGLAKAQNWMGHMYELGNGVPQNHGVAIIWYRMSAKQGNADAQWSLGNAYCFGRGVDEDYAEAARWYRASAEQGNEEAQFELGMLYYGGKGVEQDFSQAVKWLRKAAIQGDSLSQYKLGMLCYYGKGVDQDIVESITWIRKSAEQGYSDAEFILGNLYYKGEGVNPSYLEAKKWYELAALQSVFYAQYALGEMHEFGKGVAINYVVAFKWYYLAASGNPLDDPDHWRVWNLFEPSRFSLANATASRDRVAEFMSSEDFQNARGLIRTHEETLRSRDAEMESILART